MIWLVARDKKNMPEKKRRFNNSVARIYLAISLSMYPVTALAFIGTKVFHPLGQTNIYSLYFITWLVLIIFFLLKRDINFTNKWSLISGSILGFLIPIANGICTGNWFWKTFAANEVQIFFVDIFWIVLASITLYVSFKLKKVKSE